MNELGRILIADDEETFLFSTADLLKREGYYCDCVSNTADAVNMLNKNKYDLLMADIKMPGNSDLELIRQLSKIAAGMPTILMTGYPSKDSAIQAIGLPVIAYMIKPFSFDDLMIHVHNAMERSSLYNAVSVTRQRLEQLLKSINEVEKNISDKSKTISSKFITNFLNLTYENIAGTVNDIRQMTSATTGRDISSKFCYTIDCPKLKELTEAVEKTVNTLEKTKGAFKSKDLGQLRKTLEDVLEKNKKV